MPNSHGRNDNLVQGHSSSFVRDFGWGWRYVVVMHLKIWPQSMDCRQCIANLTDENINTLKITALSLQANSRLFRHSFAVPSLACVELVCVWLKEDCAGCRQFVYPYPMAATFVNYTRCAIGLRLRCVCVFQFHLHTISTPNFTHKIFSTFDASLLISRFFSFEETNHKLT